MKIILVSGDADLLALQQHKATRMMTFADFRALVMKDAIS